MRKIFLRFSSIIASLALIVTTINVNLTCMYIVHQPQLPKNSKKLRRF